LVNSSLAGTVAMLQLFLQTKPKARKEILENCQTHEQEQAINPNLVA